MSKRVVVTGIGAVTPVGNDAASTWESLVSGKNGIDKITRFDTEDFKCTLAAEVKDYHPLNYFDKMFVGKTDLYVLYALTAAEEAMKDSGLSGNINPEQLSVYFGSGVGGVNTLCEEQTKLINQGARRVSPQFVPKMIINIAAGQIAIKYNAHGSAICMSSACATGTSTIGEAYRAIRDGYTTAAICGGSEAAVNTLCIAGFQNLQALSQSENKDEASLPFDARRGGFVLGEGAGVVILEEYEHAVARGAKIYCEVVGYGVTCDAYHITAPDTSAVYTGKAIGMALNGVDYDASKVYVNAHGTGTHYNDIAETTAFKNCFGKDAYKLTISSTKSMTGHLLGAAGAVEAIACIKTLQTGIVAPTINLKEPDPECDLDYTPNIAVKKDIELAISTSLGFGGHNACVAFKRI